MANESTHELCIASTVAAIEELRAADSLPLFPEGTTRISSQTVPVDDDKAPLPRILVTPFIQESYDPTSGPLGVDDIDYPVLVAILGAQNREQLLKFPFSFWRETIAAKFRNKRPDAAWNPPSTINFTTVEFLAIVDKNAWFDHNLYAGGFIVWWKSRQP